jgi:hypothetical protein
MNLTEHQLEGIHDWIQSPDESNLLLALNLVPFDYVMNHYMKVYKSGTHTKIKYELQGLSYDERENITRKEFNKWLWHKDNRSKVIASSTLRKFKGKTPIKTVTFKYGFLEVETVYKWTERHKKPPKWRNATGNGSVRIVVFGKRYWIYKNDSHAWKPWVTNKKRKFNYKFKHSTWTITKQELWAWYKSFWSKGSNIPQ